jgi:hypothetical protein
MGLIKNWTFDILKFAASQIYLLTYDERIDSCSCKNGLRLRSQGGSVTARA